MVRAIIREMIGDLPVGLVDVVRLFMEAIELGRLKCDTREELIAGVREIVTLGAQAREQLRRTQPFGVVVEMSLKARSGRRKSTLADLRSYSGRMVRYDGWKGKALRSIGVEECREMLSAVFGHSVSAFKKGRAVLHSIFAYGMRQGWCDRNPVDGVDVPQVTEKMIEPLDVPSVNRLVEACNEKGMEGMAPPVALMLWCGIRPGEVQRLRWGDINLKEKVVYVSASASKTGGVRCIPLRGAAWKLLRNATPSSLIAPPNWANRWRALRKCAGFDHWQQDALRHTFASMHLCQFRNLIQLQAEMGHRDCRLLLTRYINLRGVTEASAKEFWRL